MQAPTPSFRTALWRDSQIFRRDALSSNIAWEIDPDCIASTLSDPVFDIRELGAKALRGLLLEDPKNAIRTLNEILDLAISKIPVNDSRFETLGSFNRDISVFNTTSAGLRALQHLWKTQFKTEPEELPQDLERELLETGFYKTLDFRTAGKREVAALIARDLAPTNYEAQKSSGIGRHFNRPIQYGIAVTHYEAATIQSDLISRYYSDFTTAELGLISRKPEGALSYKLLGASCRGIFFVTILALEKMYQVAPIEVAEEIKTIRDDLLKKAGRSESYRSYFGKQQSN